MAVQIHRLQRRSSTLRPGKNTSAKPRFFLTREQIEEKRRKQEEALLEMKKFLGEYGSGLTDADLVNEQTFRMWLLKNGLMQRFSDIWQNKVIFENIYGKH